MNQERENLNHTKKREWDYLMKIVEEKIVVKRGHNWNEIMWKEGGINITTWYSKQEKFS